MADSFLGLAENEQVLVKATRCWFVGGWRGSGEHVSPNLVAALEFAKRAGATTLGIVGRTEDILRKSRMHAW